MIVKKYLISIGLLILCLFTMPSYASTQFYKVTNIFDNDTLNVRQGASTKTPIVLSLPYNTKNIEVIEKKANSTWVKISVPNSRTVGWVNSRYLKQYSDQLPTVYSCSGTEPFWRMDMDTKTKKIAGHVLSNGGDHFTVSMSVNTRAMNSPQQSRIITGKNKRHSVTAFIVEGSCSDGMSDKVFDYQITALFNNKAYQGCCDAVKATAKTE